ncbi:hypothetical protein BLA29_001594 [Euroglyphus maynei]|uniref:Uncharacterized protein n=1 Tax=Euroglyphus maynei TaxID=6958 RepID=A0A1Y3B9W0_EURMA|nr:hypothetical protein BLA29_001594 [Euroglyphus maynei]
MEERRSCHSLHNCLRTSRSHPSQLRSSYSQFPMAITNINDMMMMTTTATAATTMMATQAPSIIYSNTNSTSSSHSQYLNASANNGGQMLIDQQPQTHHEPLSSLSVNKNHSHTTKSAHQPRTPVVPPILQPTSSKQRHQHHAPPQPGIPSAVPGTIVTYTVVRPLNPNKALRSNQLITVPLEFDDSIIDASSTNQSQSDSVMIDRKVASTNNNNNDDDDGGGGGESIDYRHRSPSQQRLQVERSRSAPYSMLSSSTVMRDGAQAYYHISSPCSGHASSRSSTSSPGANIMVMTTSSAIRQHSPSLSRSSSCCSLDSSSPSTSVSNSSVSCSSAESSFRHHLHRHKGGRHHGHGRHYSHEPSQHHAHSHRRSHSDRHRSSSYHHHKHEAGTSGHGNHHHHHHHHHRHHRHHDDHDHHSHHQKARRSSSYREPSITKSKLISIPMKAKLISIEFACCFLFQSF